MAALTPLTARELETSGILRGLRSRDPYDQYFAVIGIEEAGRIDLLAQLIPLFHSRYLDVRTAAIRTVGMLGFEEPGFYTATILPMLADRSVSTRYEAAEALGRLGHLNSYEGLREAAESDPHAEVRERAAQSARLVSGHPIAGDEVDTPRIVSFNPFRLAGL